VSTAIPDIACGVIGPPVPTVTAVRNWNAAGSRARGDLLVVIADDLMPCPRWDEQLDEVLRSLDAARTPIVVKVSDTDGDDDNLIRHPVVSRCFYERYGLWESGYEGHYVDHDFFQTAHRQGVVIDGRAIRLMHRNPAYGAEDPPTESQRRISADTRVSGRARFDDRWPAWRRRYLKRYFRPRAQQHSVCAARMKWRHVLGAAGYLRVLGAPLRSLRR
jgi:hypothetical protein